MQITEFIYSNFRELENSELELKIIDSLILPSNTERILESLLWLLVKCPRRFIELRWSTVHVVVHKKLRSEWIRVWDLRSFDFFIQKSNQDQGQIPVPGVSATPRRRISPSPSEGVAGEGVWSQEITSNYIAADSPEGANQKPEFTQLLAKNANFILYKN